MTTTPGGPLYILTDRPARARSVLEHMAASLSVPTGPVHEVDLGSHRLLWMRAQARDNLHVHPDGVLVGRHRAAEELRDAPIVHDEPLPAQHPSPLPGVVIRRDPVTVEPLGSTLAFRGSASVSDRQLLLAALDGLAPSAAGVALLAGLGYFPGDATLFDEVRCLPLLERWDVAARRGSRTRTLELPRPDDAAMIDRLVSLVPTDVRHGIGLSGGYDSRFMLGILHRAGADVRIVRFTDSETPVAAEVARQLGVELLGIGAPGDHDAERSWFEFTLLTDAQIWHSVAQNGRLRQHLTPHDMFHSGQFSDSLTKNTFKTAWKVPDPRRPFWDRLIDEAFLPNAPQVQPTLRAVARKEELREVVRGALDGQRSYVEFRTHKQWANWLHYANRAMRWSQALYDDLTFSSNLVYLLSDLDSQLLGIATGFWPNFHNDRVRELNRRLLPEVDAPYLGGVAPTVQGGVKGAWTKVEYEYLQRFRTARTARARLQAIDTTYLDDLPEVQPPGYELLFDRPMQEVATQGRFGLRRASVTVANVLTHLQSANDACAAASD